MSAPCSGVCVGLPVRDCQLLMWEPAIKICMQCFCNMHGAVHECMTGRGRAIVCSCTHMVLQSRLTEDGAD